MTNDHALAGVALSGVIDGLGHGPFAHRAARTARHSIEAHYDQPLQNLFRGARRLVMIANVGNVEVRLLDPSPHPRPPWSAPTPDRWSRC